jgi:hypothetical protein
MTRDSIVNRLGELSNSCQRALDLLAQGRSSAQKSPELRDIVRRLKSEIRAEYKRTSPISAQEKMSAEESAYYLPAIHEAYYDTGLSALRAETKPKEEWYSIIEAVNAKLKYYLHQLEPQND